MSSTKQPLPIYFDHWTSDCLLLLGVPGLPWGLSRLPVDRRGPCIISQSLLSRARHAVDKCRIRSSSCTLARWEFAGSVFSEFYHSFGPAFPNLLEESMWEDFPGPTSPSQIAINQTWKWTAASHSERRVKWRWEFAAVFQKSNAWRGKVEWRGRRKSSELQRHSPTSICQCFLTADCRPAGVDDPVSSSSLNAKHSS